MDFYLKTKNREALDNIKKIGTINEKKNNKYFEAIYQSQKFI